MEVVPLVDFNVLPGRWLARASSVSGARVLPKPAVDPAIASLVDVGTRRLADRILQKTRGKNPKVMVAQ